MKKFTSIKELYPTDYQNFYPKPEPAPSAGNPDAEPDTETDDSELLNPTKQIPEPSVREKPKQAAGPGATTRAQKVETFANDSLKSSIISTIKNNLINIVILLIGFFLVSNDAVLAIIDDKITKNNIAGMAIRGLGLVVFYIALKTAATILL